MALGFFSELLAEGFIFRGLTKIWSALKEGLGHPVVQEWATKNLAPKGLDDEAVFSFILAKAKMGKKKSKLIRVINRLEKRDKRDGTRYVSNFRLIVAMDAIGRGTIKTEKKKNGDDVVRTIPDPAWQHPGISILEILAKECNSDAEMVQFIVACGAMQDAPFGTMDEFFHWAKKTAWPWISSQWNSLRQGVISGLEAGEEFYGEVARRREAWQRQSLLRKILDPRNWFGY